MNLIIDHRQIAFSQYCDTIFIKIELRDQKLRPTSQVDTKQMEAYVSQENHEISCLLFE